MNPIHWNEDFARSVGLPNVIAHGMFTMGAAVGLVTEWAGDPGAVVDYQTHDQHALPRPVGARDRRHELLLRAGLHAAGDGAAHGRGRELGESRCIHGGQS